MSVHTKIDKEGIYFITFCYGWLNRQGHTVLTYVIMPNHLHLLLHYSGGKSLNTVIGNGKRFMAYEIVSLLEQKGEETLLKKLRLK